MVRDAHTGTAMKAFRLGQRIAHCVLLIVAVIPLAFTLWEIAKFVEVIGGVDFYYYLCTARDRVRGVTPVTPRSVGYFPGFAWVWGTALSLWGENLTAIQWIYFCALLANTILVGSVVWSAGATLVISVVCASVYIWAAVQVEGLEGCLEAFTTLPFLCGLLGLSVLMRRGVLGPAMVVVGLCGALTVFMKQQGALLLVGSLGLLPCIFRGTDSLIRWRHLGVAALSFCAFLLLLFAMDSEGFAGLIRGIRLFTSYESIGSLSDNLQGPYRALSPLPEIAGVLLVYFGVVSILTRAEQTEERLRRIIILVTTIAATASLCQFTKRGYLHYALVGLAPFSVAFGVSLDTLWRAFWRDSLWHRCLSVLVTLAVLVLVYRERASLTRQYEHILATRLRPTATQEAAPFASVCDHVRPGSELFLFPSRRNVIHWICGTTSTVWGLGYGFAPTPPSMVIDTITNPLVQAVFVTDPALGDYHYATDLQLKGEPIRKLLTSSGFVSVLVLERGELFTRNVRVGSGNVAGE